MGNAVVAVVDQERDEVGLPASCRAFHVGCEVLLVMTGRGLPPSVSFFSWARSTKHFERVAAWIGLISELLLRLELFSGMHTCHHPVVCLSVQ